MNTLVALIKCIVITTSFNSVVITKFHDGNSFVEHCDCPSEVSLNLTTLSYIETEVNGTYEYQLKSLEYIKLEDAETVSYVFDLADSKYLYFIFSDDQLVAIKLQSPDYIIYRYDVIGKPITTKDIITP